MSEKRALKIRVLHLPYNTPYVKKLVSSNIEIVNGITTSTGLTVPYAPSFEWLCNADSLDFFDVLHIHFFEFSSLEAIRKALEICHNQTRTVIITIHDLCPMFNDKEDFEKKLTLLCVSARNIIIFSQKAASILKEKIKIDISSRFRIIPHGFVLNPKHHLWGKGNSGYRRSVKYCSYGSFRPNRDIYSVLLKCFHGIQKYKAEFNILGRTPDLHKTFANDLRLSEILNLVAVSEKRINLRLKPFPTDDEIVEFLSKNNILLMPYRWGTHSGQLELAFDLNIIPVISDVGLYKQQWEESSPFVPEPIWFNWDDNNTSAHGVPFLTAFEESYERACAQVKFAAKEYSEHRVAEHERILDAHKELYFQ